MKKLILLSVLICLVATIGNAGTEYSGKELKQTQAAPCPEWYGDNEFTVNLWGTYLWTNTDYNRNLWRQGIGWRYYDQWSCEVLRACAWWQSVAEQT